MATHDVTYDNGDTQTITADSIDRPELADEYLAYGPTGIVARIPVRNVLSIVRADDDAAGR